VTIHQKQKRSILVVRWCGSSNSKVLKDEWYQAISWIFAKSVILIFLVGPIKKWSKTLLLQIKIVT